MRSDLPVATEEGISQTFGESYFVNSSQSIKFIELLLSAKYCARDTETMGPCSPSRISQSGVTVRQGRQACIGRQRSVTGWLTDVCDFSRKGGNNGTSREIRYSSNGPTPELYVSV